jgi:NAD(P)H-dependent FMN reductase
MIPKTREMAYAAFRSADRVLIGFPLYTDAMPGLAKTFFEDLEPYTDQTDNPLIAFLVQSGFVEAHHSRFVERYLEKLAKRLGAPYAGTIIKGGCEGVRLQPEDANSKLFAKLQALGADLANHGNFNSTHLKRLAKPERIPRLLVPLIRVILKKPGTQSYWDNQLKKHGVYDDRFAKPFKENP